MKKHLTILLSILLALTVCATRADTTVKILHLQETPKYLEVWKQIGADFEKQNPGVKIDWQFLKTKLSRPSCPRRCNPRSGRISFSVGLAGSSTSKPGRCAPRHYLVH